MGKYKTRTARLTLVPATIIALLLIGTAPRSATAGPEEFAPADSVGLAEIVVTAQKRSESLQSVPVSVTVLTGAQLGALKLDSPSDLAAQIPNLQVDGVNGEGSPIFSLRGVSMFDYSLNQSSPVASYVDEVYKGNIVLFGVEMYDLDHVEVLRGPQGTLYGKNSTGGAINFITKKPGFDTEGNITVGAGNYNRKEGEGAFQVGIVPDVLAARVAFTYTKVDGFIRNVLPGYPDLEATNQWGARLSLLYNISDGLTATLRMSVSRQIPIQYAVIAGNIGAGGLDGVGGYGYYRTRDGTSTGVPLANDEVAQSYGLHREQNNRAMALTVNWSIDRSLALTSITSWDAGSLIDPDNTDGAPIDIWKSLYYARTHQVTQDLRLTSTGEAPFQFISGAYYQHELIHNSAENLVYNLGGSDHSTCEDSSFGAGQGYYAGFIINGGCNYRNSFDQTRNGWAIYTDDSYALNALFKLRAGLRYTHENAIQKNALDQLLGSDSVPIANLGFFSTQPGPNGEYYGPTLALPGSSNYSKLVDQSRSQALHNTATTGHFGLDFTPTKDILVYLGYSRGFRAGAFNGQFLYSPQDFSAVKPETIDSIEAGFKTAWFENRLQLNGAIFHYQYKNQQLVDVRPDGTQPLINLAKSKIDGGELELVARPVQKVTLHAGLGLLNAKVQEGTIGGGTIPVKGHQLPESPRVSVTLSSDWEAFNIGPNHVILHVDSNYTSKQYFELSNENRIAQDRYALLNGRLTWNGADDKWNVGLWAKNITNHYYLTNAYDLQSLGFDYEHRGMPREFGIDAGYRF